MTNLASKDSHDEKPSVFSVTYHEIGETYTWLKENVTEKLSNYLLTYGAALAHHPSIKEEEKEEPIDPLKQEIEKEAVPENTRENIETEIENTEPIIETKKEKKKKKKDKKEKKNKKK